MTDRPRKIVHVDMDAFYASIEQRDQAAWRGRPLIVAWDSPRSVVCAASYEARRFKVHSAMPVSRAKRLCPDAIFAPPDFPRYRAVSQQIRSIFRRYTALIEPLSLDEAYLDVTADQAGLGSATAIAEAIRKAIREELNLTASAGIAPNKFLAKIASDWNKPDGQWVIKPHQVADFLAPLPVRKIPGIGRVMNRRLAELDIHVIADLRNTPAERLREHFGNSAQWLLRRAWGEDDSPVRNHRPAKSMSMETTFEQDRRLDELGDTLARLSDKLWRQGQKSPRIARTVTIKLKTAQFQILSRSITPEQPVASAEQLAHCARELLKRAPQDQQQRYRLLGLGLSNFVDAQEIPQQNALFD